MKKKIAYPVSVLALALMLLQSLIPKVVIARGYPTTLKSKHEESAQVAPSAATLIVSNTNDSGSGSFRQAIIDANNMPSHDIIGFDVGGGGAQTIKPLSPLPSITDSVTIDGQSQPGFRGIPLIELDGSMAGPAADGLRIEAGDIIIQGLAINRFGGNGINIIDIVSGQTLIQGNNLGTNRQGTTIDPDGVPNSGDETGNVGEAIRIVNSSNVIVGGNVPLQANIIGGNGDGMSFINSSNNIVQGNFIGTNPLLANLGNRGAGIGLAGASSNNKIGGVSPNLGNTIAFNQTGILGFPGAVGNLYLSNSISNNSLTGIDNNGANRDIRPPQLISAVASANNTAIIGRYIGFPGIQYGLHFYLSPNSSPPGQGKNLLGGFTVTTNGSGVIDFTTTVPVALPALPLTALATNLITNDTSEFSIPLGVTSTASPDIEVRKTGPESAKCGDSITWTIEVRNVGTARSIGSSVVDTLPECVADVVGVTISDPTGISYPQVVNQVVTLLPGLDPGAPPVTITITATLTQACSEQITNLVAVTSDGDVNTLNNSGDVVTEVDCVKITGIDVQGKNVIVSGLGFQKKDKVEINGMLVKTKFLDINTLLAKKGKKFLFDCDPANPGRTNFIKLIRSRNPGPPILDTQAFATCP